MLTNIMGEIKKHNIEIVETIMVGRLKAVYIDSYIFIDKRLSTKEKISILAEELHHHIYDYGDISSKNMNAYKYELTTRRRTFEYLLPLHKIKKLENYARMYTKWLTN